VFRKVLYPTDFSEYAKKALKYVKELEKVGVEVVVVLNVIEKSYIDAYEEAFAWAGRDIEKETEKLDERLIKKAKDNMKEIVRELEGFEVVEVIRIGTPYEEILKVAESENVDLIVIGSHGCGKLMCEFEKLIGSTAENVIRHSKMPVLIVR